MSMYFGSEFYEENHGEWLEQFIAKHGPKSLKMNRFEIEGRLGRLWNATQKLHQMFVSHDELAMYSGISRALFRYSESYSRASGVFKFALVERGLLIPVVGHDDKFEIAGNRKRIEAILKKSNDGSESARRRWEKEKAMGNPLGNLCDTQCNDNDNDNVLNTLAGNCVSATGEKPTEKKKPRVTKKGPKVKLGAAVFAVYKKHYCERYGDCPPPGQVGYSMLKDVAEQFGVAQAQDLAIFYLTEYEDDYCARQCHPINLFKSKRNDIWLKLKEKYDLEYTDLEANDGRVAEAEQLDSQVLDATGT